MNQLDMFAHQAELPMAMPAPVSGLLLEAMAAAPSTPVLEPAPPAPPARPGQPAVRYMHPTSMQTWTGRGKPPRWITEWLEEGNTLDAVRLPDVTHA